MSKKIQPITALRDTNKLENDLKENDGLIYITKNGYESFVLLSPENYEFLAKSYAKPHYLNNESKKNNQFIAKEMFNQTPLALSMSGPRQSM